MKKNGFTLIELLIVIAIIGILASVVVSSLNSARNKATDAAIKSTISSMRSQASMYYDENKSYGDSDSTCTSTSIVNLFTSPSENSLKKSLSSLTIRTADLVCVVDSDLEAYIVAAQLKTDTNTYYCVDADGAATIFNQSELANARTNVSCHATTTQP